MIDMLMPSKESPSQVMADYDTMRVGGEFFPCNVRTFLMRHAARGSGLPFEDRPEIQVRLAAMLDILDKSSSRIVTIHDSLRRPREQMSPFEIIMSTVLTKEGVDDISRTIMLHHRTPGDPAIREKGAVIADVSPQLVRSDLAEGSQVILVVRGPALVGLAFFFPPERIPSHFSTLNARFPETSNAALLQVLVAPSAQGSGVFDCVMNATLTALQSCGAQLLIGEVEHTNERAQRAYQKYNGSLHTTYRSESLSPSGISTSFIGLSIPISGTEHEQSYFRNAIDAR
jgi:ribosomal protein S18 acetylase RimI-like enzyme